MRRGPGDQDQFASTTIYVSSKVQLIVVRTEKGDGRRVVVKLIELDVETLDHVAGNRQGQRRMIGLIELVQGAANAVVIEQFHVGRGKPQQVGGIAAGPFTHAIDWTSRQQRISDQDHQCPVAPQFGSAVFARQILLQKLFQLHLLQDPIEDRQRSDAMSGKPRAASACRASRGTIRFESFRPLLSLDHHVPSWTMTGSLARHTARASASIHCPVGADRQPQKIFAPTYDKCYRRKSSATRLTSKPIVVSHFAILLPAASGHCPNWKTRQQFGRCRHRHERLSLCAASCRCRRVSLPPAPRVNPAAHKFTDYQHEMCGK